MGNCYSWLKNLCPWLKNSGTPSEQRPLISRPTGTRPILMRPKYGAPEGKDWYHSELTDREAELRMQDNAMEIYGAFLVYDDPQRKDAYKIIAHKDGVLHRFIIRRRQDNLKFEIFGQDDKCFAEVKDLIHHYRGVTGTPLKLPNRETLTLSKDYKWSPQ